jgi:hypothetical protein
MYLGRRNPTVVGGPTTGVPPTLSDLEMVEQVPRPTRLYG